MLLGGDLQHCRDGLHVSVNGVTDHLGNELVDQDDADVVTDKETPTGVEMEVYTQEVGFG